MAPRCLVAAAEAHLHPAGEPDVLMRHRRRLLARAAGRVLDLSDLWSANLAHYRSNTVATVTVLTDRGGGGPGAGRGSGPRSRPSALASPEGAWSLDVVRRDGRPDALEMEPASVDTLVATFALCGIDALDVFLDRVRRWLAPGAHVLVLEHVVGTGTTGWWQRAATPFGRAWADGCRLDVDATGSLRRAGLVTGDCARFRLPGVGPLAVPCVATVARPRRPRRQDPAA